MNDIICLVVLQNYNKRRKPGFNICHTNHVANSALYFSVEFALHFLVELIYFIPDSIRLILI
jgi:hypothetical protein